MSRLDDHLEALRAAGDGDGDAELALATRRRLRESLDRDHHGRRQLISTSAAIAILLGGTVSWALVTGKLPALWHPRPQVSEPAPPPPAAPVQHALPAPYGRAELPLAPPSPPTPPPPPASHPPRAAHVAPTPVEALYRRAHALHFHGNDYAAALAAWDAYLAAEPAGRFSVEARYNRALCLVRLGRLVDAKQALLPFVRGDVEPIGYRHDEAAALVDRLDRLDRSRRIEGLNE